MTFCSLYNSNRLIASLHSEQIFRYSACKTWFSGKRFKWRHKHRFRPV